MRTQFEAGRDLHADGTSTNDGATTPHQASAANLSGNVDGYTQGLQATVPLFASGMGIGVAFVVFGILVQMIVSR